MDRINKTNDLEAAFAAKPLSTGNSGQGGYKNANPHSSGNNPDCCINSQQCSVTMGNVFWNVCDWHTYLMAFPEPFNCSCGKSRYVMGGTAWPRIIFWKYWSTKNSAYAHIKEEDILVADFSGIYCCSSARSNEETTHTCGDVKICRCCVKVHPGCMPDRYPDNDAADDDYADDNSADVDSADEDSADEDSADEDSADEDSADDSSNQHAIPRWVNIGNGKLVPCSKFAEIYKRVTVDYVFATTDTWTPHFTFDKNGLLRLPLPNGPILNAAGAIRVASVQTDEIIKQRFIFVAGFFGDCPYGIKRHW